jgi:hypothetical protein
MNLKNIFERVYCINLAKRKDRWKQFCDALCNCDWPFRRPIRWEAINGSICAPPDWWTSGAGAWGCYQSHLGIIRQCLNDGVRSVLILEDDAVLLDERREQLHRFFEQLPAGWRCNSMIYLGGQHLKVEQQRPRRLNPDVYQPFNVNRTHAYAICGEMLKTLNRFLHETHDWPRGAHIDHRYGQFHQQATHPVYVPARWMFAQSASSSSISGKRLQQRSWDDAANVSRFVPQKMPFVAILGLFGAGTERMADIIRRLGIHLGGESSPESRSIYHLCNSAIPAFATHVHTAAKTLRQQLGQFVFDQKRTAWQRQLIAGAKHPLLCRLASHLQVLCGKQLRVIDCQQPLQESIEFLQRRNPQVSFHTIRSHQDWLYEGKQELFASLDGRQILHVPLQDVMNHPRLSVQRIASFIGIKPTNRQMEEIIQNI